jgi:hypothetical protein
MKSVLHILYGNSEKTKMHRVISTNITDYMLKNCLQTIPNNSVLIKTDKYREQRLIFEIWKDKCECLGAEQVKRLIPHRYLLLLLLSLINNKGKQMDLCKLYLLKRYVTFCKRHRRERERERERESYLFKSVIKMYDNCRKSILLLIMMIMWHKRSEWTKDDA